MLTASRRIYKCFTPGQRFSDNSPLPGLTRWQIPDKCPGGISMLGTDWATRSCLKLLNIPELISKPLEGETLIKNVCIAVRNSPFWGNSKKLKKVHAFVPLCIHHWNSLRTSLWLHRRIRFRTYYSLKVVSLQKDVWGMTAEIPYWWQVATQIWISKNSDWLCYSCRWEILPNWNTLPLFLRYYFHLH